MVTHILLDIKKPHHFDGVINWVEVFRILNLVPGVAFYLGHLQKRVV